MNTVGLQNILDDFLEEHCIFYAQAHQVNHAWITQKKKLIYMPAGNGYWSRWFLQGGFGGFRLGIHLAEHVKIIL